MAETSAEPTPKGISRRNFLRWGVAGVAGGLIAQKVLETIRSAASAREMHSLEEASQVLFARLGMSKGVFYITGDHIAHYVSPDAVLMGETRSYQLYTTQDDVDREPKERIVYPNGVEWIFGRERMQEFYTSIRTPKLVISTDGDAMYSRKYIEANGASALTIRDLVMKLYDIAPMASFLGTFLATLRDQEMSRRTFLKIFGIGVAGGVATELLGKNILSNLDLTDLHNFPPLWQKLISLLPFEDSVPLRNKIMPVNMNALNNVPLYMMTHNAHIFAGGGHREMASEILRKPAEVREDLRRFLIGDTTNKGILYNLFDIYHQAANDVDHNTVVLHTADMLGSLFAPVAMRVNYTKMRDDLGAFHSMQRFHSMYEKNEATGSAFMTFTRSLKEIEDRLIYHTDPFLRGDKVYGQAWEFFQRVANWIYSPMMASPIVAPLDYFFINTKERFFIGHPVAFQKGQEHLDLFNYKISLDRGFVTRIEESEGKG